uniref:Secreted protein n=1 Tax=Octopus bimaculoides TaxID=37653 RepID=A0A0L8FSL6_OCTBM
MRESPEICVLMLIFMLRKPCLSYSSCKVILGYNNAFHFISVTVCLEPSCKITGSLEITSVFYCFPSNLALSPFTFSYFIYFGFSSQL